MRLSRRWGDESGSASVEFLTIGMLFLVPLVYLILSLSQLQGAAFASEGAAWQAARVFAQAPNMAAAKVDAERAIAFALDDYGIDRRAAEVEIHCTPKPAECLTRSGTVSVTIRVAVALPLAPSALAIDAPASIPVQSTAAVPVSSFWRAVQG